MRLSARLLLPILAVVILIMTAFAAWNSRRREEMLLSETQRETRAYATALALAVEYAFEHADDGEIRRIIERVTREPKIYSAIVYGKTGEVVQSAAPLEAGDAWPVTEARALMRANEVSAGNRVIRDERVYSVFRPLRGPDNSTIGALEVVQPLAFIEQEILRSRLRVAGATLALTIGLAAVLLLLVRRIIGGPLELIVEGARAIGRGEFSHRLPQTGARELAELSAEFNRMAKHLDLARNELMQQTQDRLALELKLAHAEKLALAGNLAAGVAHEIAAPLNVVAGRAELLTRVEKNRIEQQRDLRIIIDQIGRITVIVRNLLDFARRRPPLFQPTDVSAVLRGVLDLLETEVERAGVHVQTQRVKPARVNGDPQLLHQVFINLLLNAVQSVEQVEDDRNIELVVEVDEPRRMVVIDVIDEGVGVASAVLERLFEPFFTTKQPGGGTGLGLAVCRSIVEEHEGRLEALPGLRRDGRGAVFRIWLPAMDDHE